MDVNLPDLNLLRPLLALVRTRHVGRAAESLGMSQPAMSRALANLRQSLGDPLLVRTGHLHSLTPLAQSLAETLPDLLQGLDRKLAPSRFVPATAETSFRVGLLDYEAWVLLPLVAKALASEAPRVRLDIVGGSAAHLRHITDGTLDASIQSPRSPPEGCRRSTLFREGMLTLFPKVLAPLTLERFTSVGHVAVSTPDSDRSTIDLALEERGLARVIRIKVPYFAAAFRIAATSGTIYTGPARLMRSMPLPKDMALAPPPLPGLAQSEPVSLYWPERLHHDDANRWLRTLLRRVTNDF